MKTCFFIISKKDGSYEDKELLKLQEGQNLIDYIRNPDITRIEITTEKAGKEKVSHSYYEVYKQKQKDIIAFFDKEVDDMIYQVNHFVLYNSPLWTMTIDGTVMILKHKRIPCKCVLYRHGDWSVFYVMGGEEHKIMKNFNDEGLRFDEVVQNITAGFFYDMEDKTWKEAI